METSGLALLWPIDGFGEVLLPTTCLPERTQVYNLNVEIARAKLMQIVNKREDWAFFKDTTDLGTGSKEAQKLFVQAIQNISDAGLAAKLADESLKKAILFSEKLAIKQADTLLEMRSENRGFGRGCFGCKIDPEKIGDPKYLEKIRELFGFVTIPIGWKQIETAPDDYDFSTIDKCVDVLEKEKLALGAGPLLCFSKEHLPDWLMGRQYEFEKVRDTAYKFVSKVVGRYCGSIRIWRVINGLNAFNYFGFNFEQVLEMTRAASMAVKAASDRAFKIIELHDPWGEYYAVTPGTIPPLVYMDMVIQSGINFDAFGMQMRLGRDKAGMYVRDMMHTSAMLDYFLPLGKPLYITEVEVPSSSGGDAGSGGTWHHIWDQTNQAKWIADFYKTTLSKPFIDSVTYSNLVDAKSNLIADSGLLTKELEEKKSFKALKELYEAIFSR